MKKPILLLLAAGLASMAVAQNPAQDRIRTTNFPEPKKLAFAEIPGAPRLSPPQLITGSAQDIRAEKHGLIYPAFFDWNRDGKKDLLLGEFETGQTGSYIKVYLNKGTNEKPEFTGEYTYATDIKGDTITNYQWCCIGIHPRLVDLDGDGFLDILSGQYNPGAITWWRGSAKGFLPGVVVDQEGYTGETVSGFSAAGEEQPKRDSPKSFSYWNYTSADFGDFNGDGLPDLFVGGSGGPRVALNVGTKEHPKFGLRKDLLHVDGTQINPSRMKGDGQSYVGKSYIHPVDWDNDGVLDILMTHEYCAPGQNPIEFFKGVKTPDGLRFETARALFTAEDGSKALPGCQPMITIVDYNNDGILDIVMGISIPTVNGFEAVPEIAWEWTSVLDIQMPGKDAGRAVEWEGGLEKTMARIAREPSMKHYFLGKLDDVKYLTMRHRGYVFVMYGAKPEPKKMPNFVTMFRQSAPQEEQTGSQGKISYRIELPAEIEAGKEYTAKVVFSFAEGWHGYSGDKANVAQGFIPTTAEFIFPNGIKAGKISPSSGSLVYEGKGLTFSQTFTCPPIPKAVKSGGELSVTVKIQWQVCDSSTCLPPENVTVEKKVKYK